MWPQKILKVYVYNPDVIVENLKPWRRLMFSTRKKWPEQTPLEIIATELDYDLNKLEVLLNEHLGAIIDNAYIKT